MLIFISILHEHCWMDWLKRNSRKIPMMNVTFTSFQETCTLIYFIGHVFHSPNLLVMMDFANQLFP
jgi:hypothetical protein